MRLHHVPASGWFLALLLAGCTSLPSKDELLDPDGDGAVWGDDCDNGDAGTFPGADEVWYDDIDNDCDPATSDDDADGDGFEALVSSGEDCDDTSAAINPQASDIVDGIDQNCDGVDGVDQDRDGFASEISGGEDCDDGDGEVSPGADEVCDGRDNDCDGDADEDDAVDALTWYGDADGDGYGVETVLATACVQPEGYAAAAGDCDDGDANVGPDGVEAPYNGLDDDCDPSTPDDDLDGDGYNTVEGGGDDCDDGDAAVGPDETEVCDGIDNDCDSEVDEAAADALIWYVDADGDGYGDGGVTASACTQPQGYVAESGDCDDWNSAVSPDRPEDVYNGLDDDCDTSTLDDDLDGDGYYAVEGAGDDCDDGDASTYPGATEICDDGAVNDCEGDEVTAMADCGLGGTHSLSSVDLKLVGGAPDGWAGYAVSGAGDVDGDGLDDVLVGAFREGSGAAYLVLGGGALATGATSIMLAATDVTLTGEAEGDWAGYSVSGAGDVDGDGLGDVLVGAYRNDGSAPGAGAVYLLLGGGTLTTQVSPFSLAVADMTLEGENVDDAAGYSVSGAGDVDNDGRSDILVGVYSESSGGAAAGAAYLFLASGALATGQSPLSLAAADVKLVGETAGYRAGASVSDAGDVDGDGLDDILVGAYNGDGSGSFEGAAYLLLGGGVLGAGTSPVSLGAADLKLIGENGGDGAGNSVSGANDVNGDGLDDVLVSAYFEDSGGVSAGAAYLLLGGSALAPGASPLSLTAADIKLTGENAGDNAGTSVSGAGDIDGDGRGDVLIGVDGEDSGGVSAGGAYLLFSGGALATGASILSLASADVKLIGEAVGNNTGTSVSGAGDVDGDGFDELLVGAPLEDSGGLDAGATYLVLGGGY